MTLPKYPKYPIHRGERGFYTRIAKATGIGRQHVGKILQAKASYSTESLKRIARACNTDVSTLAGYIERVGVCRQLVDKGYDDLACEVDNQSLSPGCEEVLDVLR